MRYTAVAWAVRLLLHPELRMPVEHQWEKFVLDTRQWFPDKFYR